MRLEKLPWDFSICRLASLPEADSAREFFFVAKTDREISLVCRTQDVPPETSGRSDGWKGFRAAGTLDFSLVGILSELTGILAENAIGLFAVSTFDTDYILVREADFEKAVSALTAAGHTFG